MVYLLDTNAISDLMRGLPQIENWMAGLERADHVVTCPIVRGEILFGSHASRRADGARNWRREAGGSWMHCTASRYRNGRATFTRPLSWAANSVVSQWTRTTYGWRRQRRRWVRHWSAGTAISEALKAWRSWL